MTRAWTLPAGLRQHVVRAAAAAGLTVDEWVTLAVQRELERAGAVPGMPAAERAESLDALLLRDAYGGRVDTHEAMVRGMGR